MEETKTKRKALEERQLTKSPRKKKMPLGNIFFGTELDKQGNLITTRKDKYNYYGMHRKYKKLIPKPKCCPICGKAIYKKSERELKLELSNINHRYEDNIEDWSWMCHCCHRRHDTKCGIDGSGRKPRYDHITSELVYIEGIGATIAQRIKAIGIDTIEELASSNLEVLLKIRGIGELSAVNYIEKAKEYLRNE